MEDRTWTTRVISILDLLSSIQHMLTLAIETSGPLGSVALVESGRLLGEKKLALGRQHGQVLIPALGELLAGCSKRPRHCNLIAVSVGPGSFTGLRVGVVCAKTLAYAIGCPLAAVNTLHAIACNAPPDVSMVNVIGDAQRGELFTARFVRDRAADWVRQGDIQVLSAEDWAASLKGDAVVSGWALEKYGSLAERKCRILAPEFRVPQAATVARLGTRQAATGQTTDHWRLEPLYLRRSSAETQWEKLHPGK
jgi:tRNA threonylcarbamoyladenosine biosynthesis protein TsaB